MVHYRRSRTKGGVFFLTIVLRNRKSDLLVRHIDILKKSLSSIQKKYPFKNLAYVILPEHMHVLWELPVDDSDYSMRVRLLKNKFSKDLKTKNHFPGNNNDSVWQSRFWEHTIKNNDDFENHVNYIHYNPLKHGYVNRAKNWPHSSFHSYVKMGMLSADWGSNIDGENFDNTFGE